MKDVDDLLDSTQDNRRYKNSNTGHTTEPVVKSSSNRSKKDSISKLNEAGLKKLKRFPYANINEIFMDYDTPLANMVDTLKNTKKKLKEPES